MSEAGRISNLLDKANKCAARERLAKARAFTTKPCATCITPTQNIDVPTESAYLQSEVTTVCYNYVKPPVPLQSVRIAQLIKDTLSAQVDPMNADTRFSHYTPTPVIPPCPPTVFIGNTFALSCSLLPNTPLTPSLPV